MTAPQSRQITSSSALTILRTGRLQAGNVGFTSPCRDIYFKVFPVSRCYSTHFRLLGTFFMCTMNASALGDIQIGSMCSLFVSIAPIVPLDNMSTRYWYYLSLPQGSPIYPSKSFLPSMPPSPSQDCVGYFEFFATSELKAGLPAVEKSWFQ
jgi:hypothetical protein